MAENPPLPSAEQIEREIVDLWLWLGRTIRDVINNGDDWVCEDPKASKQAVEWAEIAEDCLMRAATRIEAGSLK